MILGTAITYVGYLCYFCYDVNYVYKTPRFADLQKKLEVVKRKIEVSYRFVLVMSMIVLPRLIITTMMKMEAMLIM
jgi:hypothetical protein